MSICLAVLCSVSRLVRTAAERLTLLSAIMPSPSCCDASGAVMQIGNGNGRATRQNSSNHLLLNNFSGPAWAGRIRSEEHTSELQSLMRISYAVFCLKKKQQIKKT